MKLTLKITALFFIISLAFPKSIISQVTLAEYQALQALYNATNGAGWTNNEGWNFSGSEADVTSAWHGITVSEGHVIRVELNGNNLSGNIPPAITGLAHLIRLRLNNNSLSGNIPSQIGEFNVLTELLLNNNQLSGSIPSEIGNLSNLGVLDISTNNLSGNIPPEIGNLTNLTRLRLNSNQLEGSIPNELESLTSLDRFDLDENQLTGTIPLWIGTFTQLTNFQLRSNQFSGDIPESLSNLANLEILTLQNNEFTSLPDLSGLEFIETLRIQNNILHFDHIEPNYVAFNNLGAALSYSPQAKVGEYLVYDLAFGEEITLSVEVGGSANIYQWLLNGAPITGANQTEYTINSFSIDFEGTYHCEVTNSIVPGLTISSEDIILNYLGDTAPIVETLEPTNVTANSASLEGNVSSSGGANVTQKGFYWGSEPNTVNTGQQENAGLGIGPFRFDIEGLTPGNTYYVNTYAVNSIGTAYGYERSFTAEASPPSVTTTPATEITSESARLGGEVTFDGGADAFTRGIYWSEEAGVDNTDNQIDMGVGDGSFSDVITGFIPGATYYYRAFAENITGETLGEELSFTTLALIPEVETNEAYDITPFSAYLGGYLIYNGGASINAQGVFFGTTVNPITDGQGVSMSVAEDFFENEVSNLIPATTYYFAAFATNVAGTGYGEVLSFTTEPYIPIVETLDATNVSANAATINGLVLSNQGAEITQTGFYWGLSPEPYEDGETLELGATTEFSYILEDLEPNTMYYFQAFAINSEGVGEGEILSFFTELAEQIAFIPNAFKPNSHIEANQTFKPVFEFSPADYTLQVFNRWGNLVFSTDNPDIGWDGTHRGTESPVGSYQYKLKYTDERGISHQNLGVVKLVR